MQGRTVDGTPRVLVASLGDGKARPVLLVVRAPNQPEGWFDDHGKRLGGTALADPRPGARMSSPFGTRYYYGRKSGSGFHNGIDFEGKVGEPIYAAADGVINHQGWYFNYGRTVKISHADSFEIALRPHVAFRRWHGPRHAGPQGRPDRLCRLDRTVDRPSPAFLGHREWPVRQSPALYLREWRPWPLAGEALVAYRQWQGEVKRAADRGRKGGFFGRGDGGAWSTNPSPRAGADRL